SEREAPAAMISASHNAFEDNGVKLFAPGGRKIPEALETRIEHELVELSETMPGAGPSGSGVGIASEHRTALDEYVAHVVASLDGRRLEGMAVVVGCGKGAAFRSAPAALRALGAEVEVLHASPDGANINEKCGSTDPEGLRDAVVTSGAQIGLAFDGDADRVIAVDERGELVDGDQ